jgi:5-methylcytosine-specific restriction endonuclease McrA
VLLDPPRPRHPLAAAVDHVIPLRAGGLHALANVRLVHHGCNTAHGARWTARLRRLEELREGRRA